MSERGMSSGEQLVQGILSGQVPRQVRLFAAQGLLPVSREDLLRLQTVLSADPDEELAAMATRSLQEMDPAVLEQWIKSAKVSPIELDLVCRVVHDPRVWAAAAAHPEVSDETLCVLAEHGAPVVQDIIVTNQVRLLACLEILEYLRANPQATQVVLRRVREFEEEFIEKMIHADEDVDFEDEFGPPRIEPVVHDLKEIGGHIPSEEELPFPEMVDPELAEEINERGGNAFARLLTMNIKERMMVALKGSREERAILINSRNRLVLRAVLASPKLSDAEVEKFASSRSVSDEVIRVITSNPRWMRMYGVIVALVQNPKTPVAAAVRLLTQLGLRDLQRTSRDRNISSTVRRQAVQLLQRSRR